MVPCPRTQPGEYPQSRGLRGDRMDARLSSLSVLRIDARSFIIVAVSETAVGVVSWVMQLISSSVAPAGSATRPLQVSPCASWLDLTCEHACRPGGDA